MQPSLVSLLSRLSQGCGWVVTTLATVMDTSRCSLVYFSKEKWKILEEEFYYLHCTWSLWFLCNWFWKDLRLSYNTKNPKGGAKKVGGARGILGKIDAVPLIMMFWPHPCYMNMYMYIVPWQPSRQYYARIIAQGKLSLICCEPYYYYMYAHSINPDELLFY